MKGRCVLMIGAWVATTAPAFADAKDLEGARAAYDRGAAAYDAGNYELAASELTRADDLAPNDIALELALKAAVKMARAFPVCIVQVVIKTLMPTALACPAVRIGISRLFR